MSSSRAKELSEGQRLDLWTCQLTATPVVLLGVGGNAHMASVNVAVINGGLGLG